MDFLGLIFYEKEILFILPKGKALKGGSLPFLDIYLPFRGISRHHFNLYFEDERWFIEDAGSKNGIFINGKKIKKEPLNYNDIINLSFINIKFFKKEIDEYFSLNLPKIEEKEFFNIKNKKTDTYEIREDNESLYFLPNLNFPKDIVLGKSPSMYEPYRKLSLTVEGDDSVLLIGETGTGKEVFAKTIHNSRGKGEFVPINCTAIPKELFEAEFFGMERGAATGVTEKEGKIFFANNGTLFLDEIDSMPFELQGKLLRVLEEKKFCRVGSVKERNVSFKLVSAIKKEPEILIKDGKLRDDLYHRISQSQINLPKLKERKEDLDLFINFFILKFCKKEKKEINGISEKFIKKLKEYEYEGNIRELENIISEAVKNCQPKGILDEGNLPQKVKDFEKINFLKINDEILKDGFDYHKFMDETARRIIEEALKINKGNISKTANFLKISRKGLQKIISRLKIKV